MFKHIGIILLTLACSVFAYLVSIPFALLFVPFGGLWAFAVFIPISIIIGVYAARSLLTGEPM